MPSLTRSRWAAIGAAVAVALGGGAAWVVGAGDGTPPAAYVGITPCRLVDTRADPALNVGARATPLGAADTHVVTVWGTNGNCTIPSSAVAVTANVTVVNRTAQSHMVVFPAGTTRPLASNLNWPAGPGPVGNSVSATLSDQGELAFYNHAGSVDLVVDIVGYHRPLPASTPPVERVVWVAGSGGDFTSVAAALASIIDAGPSTPYLVRIAPGVYDEPGGIDLKPYVDIEGSGTGSTLITCACGGTSAPFDGGSSATLRAVGAGLAAEVRQLTVANTGPGAHSVGVWTNATTAGSLRFSHVAAQATGGTEINWAWANVASSPDMTDVSVSAGPATNSYGVYNDASSPTMNHVTSVVGGSSNDSFGIYNTASSPRMFDVTSTSTGGGYAYGVKNYQGSQPSIIELRATATGGTKGNFAMYNGTGASPTVRSSTLVSGTHAIFNAAATAKVSHSSLGGAVTGTGFTCAFNVEATTLAVLGPGCT